MIGNCASKLKPCLVSAIQSVGGPLDSFSEIVGSLCPESSHLVGVKVTVTASVIIVFD